MKMPLAVGGLLVRLAGLAAAATLVVGVASAAPSPSGSNIRTSGTVVALAADGGRAVLFVSKPGAKSQVVVWEPSLGRSTPLAAFGSPGCSRDCGWGGSVALAGSRVAWDEVYAGNAMETYVTTATLGQRRHRQLAGGYYRDGIGGSVAFEPVGDTGLLAFTVEIRCGDPAEGEPPCPPGRELHDVISATVWRASRRGRCPASGLGGRPGHCARVARADGELTVLAVNAGRVAARTDDGVRLLSARGPRLQDFSVEKVRAAALSGDRLALRVPGAVELYDTASGELVKRISAQGSARHDRLEDLEKGILVTAMGRTVTLRRLSDGHAARIRAPGIAHAQLEPSGLFVAGGRHVRFTPMAGVERLLG